MPSIVLVRLFVTISYSQAILFLLYLFAKYLDSTHLSLKRMHDLEDVKECGFSTNVCSLY